MNKDFTTKSYERHKNEYLDTFDSKKLASWKNKNSGDYWRHERMYSNLDPIIESLPNASWLTIGDGRYGTDANYILSKGIKNVLASDISDTCLKIALEENFIADYKIENAEALTFSNDSFDFVLCKEAYHHFPRPMVALYEMLRVAKKGVILIEPQDANILIPSRFKLRTLLKWLIQVLKNFIKIKMGKELYYAYGNYEDVGNYVYSISEREIEKVALGLNFEMVSFKGINDYYLAGVEYEPANKSSALFQKVKQIIEKSDRETTNGLRLSGLLVSIIFKSAPDKDMLERLKAKGFVNRILPRNPHIT